MWFLWGFLMFFGYHVAINICLTFASKYKKSNQGMNLYVAIGAGICCIGGAIFAFSYVNKIPALIIGAVIGLCTGGLHFYLNNRNKNVQDEIIHNFYKQMDQAQKTAEKIQRLVSNPNHSEGFSQKEIVEGLINLQDAQLKLSSFEYFHIQKILNKLKTSNNQRLLNNKQYLDWCNEMISNFDMVAPYYKYCGDDSMEFLGSLMDEYKTPYRAKAKKLLESGKLLAADNWNFSSEWLALNREFKNEFYNNDTKGFIETVHDDNKIEDLLITSDSTKQKRLLLIQKFFKEMHQQESKIGSAPNGEQILCIHFQAKYLWDVHVKINEIKEQIKVYLLFFQVSALNKKDIYNIINDWNKEYLFVKFYCETLSQGIFVIAEFDIPLINESSVGAFCAPRIKEFVKTIDDLFAEKPKYLTRK